MGSGTRRSYKLKSYEFLRKMDKKRRKEVKIQKEIVCMSHAGWRERHILIGMS